MVKLDNLAWVSQDIGRVGMQVASLRRTSACY